MTQLKSRLIESGEIVSSESALSKKIHQNVHVLHVLYMFVNFLYMFYWKPKCLTVYNLLNMFKSKPNL